MFSITPIAFTLKLGYEQYVQLLLKAEATKVESETLHQTVMSENEQKVTENKVTEDIHGILTT